MVFEDDELADAIHSAGITELAGWGVQEMGCSLFVHGPLALFTFERASHDTQALSASLLKAVAPKSLYKPVRDLATSTGVQIGVRAAMKDGDALLGLRCNLDTGDDQGYGASGTVAEKEFLQALALDLAVGQTKVFDAFLLERLRQMLSAVGCASAVAAIECRAEDPALITLAVSPHVHEVSRY